MTVNAPKDASDVFTFLTYNLYTLSEGKLGKCLTWDNLAEALEAAGLRE